MPWKKLVPRSLSSRLAVVFIGYLLLSFFVIGASVIFLANMTDESRDNLVVEEQFHIVDHYLQRDSAGNLVGLDFEPGVGWMYAISPMDLQYRVVDSNGAILFSSLPGGIAFSVDGEGFHAEDKQFDLALGERIQHVRVHEIDAGRDSGRRAYIQIAISDRMLELLQLHFSHPFSTVATLILAILFALFIVMSGVAFVTLRRMLLPVSRISAAAAEISPQQLKHRLPLDGMPVELAPLLSAFNSVLDRLEKGFNEQQEFFATAAHELKTPLALLRGEIEMGNGMESREVLLQDIDHITRYVHQLLNFSEVREIRNFKFDRHDINAVIVDVAKYLQRHAERAGVTIRLSRGSPMVLNVDRSAAFVLIKNLVENAIQHSPRNSIIFIYVHSGHLFVVDQGGGISEEDFSQLFSRFWRSSQRRSEGGAGLGLAICQEVSEAHGWRLTAKNRSVGAEFSVDFGPVNFV